MIKMINDDERAEIPPLIPGRIAAALVQAMHMVDEELLSSIFEFILKMALVLLCFMFFSLFRLITEVILSIIPAALCLVLYSMFKIY